MPNGKKRLNVSQINILKNGCIKYLETQNINFGDQYKKKDIDELIASIKGGQCNGLAALWMYRKADKEEEALFYQPLEQIAEWAAKVDSGEIVLLTKAEENRISHWQKEWAKKQGLEWDNLTKKKQEELVQKIEDQLSIDLCAIWAKEHGKELNRLTTKEKQEMWLAIDTLDGKSENEISQWIKRSTQLTAADKNVILKRREEWNEKSGLIRRKKEANYYSGVFEGFMNDMVWAFGANNAMNYGQKDLDKLFDVVTKDSNKEHNSLEKEFSMAFIFKKNELIDTLKKVLVNGLEDKMIQLGSTDHAIGLMKVDGKYVLYDPNSRKGEEEFDDVETLEEAIENAFFKSFTRERRSCDNLPISINIYRRKDQTPSVLPSPEALIDSYLTLHDDVDRTSWDGYTALMFSAGVRPTLSCVKAILKHGPDLDKVSKKQDEERLNTLSRAVRDIHGDPEVVSELLKNPNAKVNEKDNKGISNLMFACNVGRPKMVTALLKGGANIDDVDANGKTPFMYAVGKVEIVNLLLNAIPKPDIHAKDKYNMTAFMYAAWGGHIDVVKALLNEVPRPNLEAISNTGKTVFMFAAESGNVALLKALLDALPEADVQKHMNMKITKGEQKGMKALNCAAAKGNVDMVQALLRLSRDPQADKNEALLDAIENGHIALVKSLINQGANINHVDSRGWAPLTIALSNDHHDIAKILVDLEAKIPVVGIDADDELKEATQKASEIIEEIARVRQAKSSLENQLKGFIEYKKILNEESTKLSGVQKLFSSKKKKDSLVDKIIMTLRNTINAANYTPENLKKIHEEFKKMAGDRKAKRSSGRLGKLLDESIHMISRMIPSSLTPISPQPRVAPASVGATQGAAVISKPSKPHKVFTPGFEVAMKLEPEKEPSSPTKTPNIKPKS